VVNCSSIIWMKTFHPSPKLWKPITFTYDIGLECFLHCWFLTLDLQVWTWIFLLHIIENIDYFGCDYIMVYSMCAKGHTFRSFVVWGLR
jgi:hypothetical protein